MILLLLACARSADTGGAPTGSAEPVSCPPPEPGGSAPGEYATDVVASDCRGEAVSLHGLCGRPALVVNYYGWCPSCGDNAALARQLADAYPELAAAVVLTEDPLGALADEAFCASYEETWPSAAAVWMDPARGLETYGSTDLVLVLDREGVLRFNRQTSNQGLIVAAVEEVVGN